MPIHIELAGLSAEIVWIALLILLVLVILIKISSGMCYRVTKIKASQHLAASVKRHFASYNFVTRAEQESLGLKFVEMSGDGYVAMTLNAFEKAKRLLIVPQFPDTHLSALVQNFAANFLKHNKLYRVDVLIHDGCLAPSVRPIIDHQCLDTEDLLNYLTENSAEDVVIAAFGISCRKVLQLAHRNPELIKKCALINCNFDWFTFNEQYLGSQNKALGAPLKEFYLRNKQTLDAEGTPLLIEKFLANPTLTAYDEAFYQDFYGFESLEDYYATVFAEPEPQSIGSECIIINNAKSPIVGALPVVELNLNKHVAYVELNGCRNHATNQYDDDLFELIFSDWLAWLTGPDCLSTPTM